MHPGLKHPPPRLILILVFARTTNAITHTMNRRLYKTELCKDWSHGHCTRGGACIFAHGKRELRKRRLRPHRKQHTQRCKHFVMTGECPYADQCDFSHEDVPLEDPDLLNQRLHPLYKTTPCIANAKGLCTYGRACRYIHKDDDATEITAWHKLGEMLRCDDPIQAPGDILHPPLPHRLSVFVEMTEAVCCA